MKEVLAKIPKKSYTMPPYSSELENLFEKIFVINPV
jgi:hypothetical protein